MGNPWCRKHETEKVRYPSGGLYCKACKSERNRAYRAAHGDRLRAHDQAMYRADRDAVRTRHAAYRTENRGACQARVRAWKVAHPEKVLADRRAWISANKDLRRAYAACRRAVKRGAVCPDVDRLTDVAVFLLRRSRRACRPLRAPVTRRSPLRAEPRCSLCALQPLQREQDRRRVEATCQVTAPRCSPPLRLLCVLLPMAA
jgi:hypothetical protein